MIIVIEGLDGAGTTTQSKLLVEELRKKTKKNVTWSKEPTDSDIGRVIRQYISSGEIPESKSGKMPMSSLFIADRKLHINSIRNSGNDVNVFDRYYLSNMAYQVNELTFSECYSFNRNFPTPDVMIFLDTSPEECISRISSRDSVDIFENIEFLTKTRDNYLSAINYLSTVGCCDTFVIKTDGKTKEQILGEIIDIVDEELNLGMNQLLFQSDLMLEVFSYSGVKIVNGNISWVTPNVPSDQVGKAFVDLSDRTTLLVCAEILSRRNNPPKDIRLSRFLSLLKMRRNEFLNAIKN